MTRLVFTRSHTVGAVGIRVATWSQWSHVGVTQAGLVVDATMKHGGVRLRALDQLIEESSEFAYARLPLAYDDRRHLDIWEAACSQVGQPYDWTGVLGLGLHREWGDTSAWWCSELAAWACEQGGVALFRPGALRRVTPQHLWMVTR